MRPPALPVVDARTGVDLILLAGAVVGLLGLQPATTTASSWRPRAWPTISVSYWAFLGPALLWLGAGLLLWRLADLALAHGRRPLARLHRAR